MKDDNNFESLIAPVEKPVHIDGRVAAEVRKIHGAVEGNLTCTRCGCNKATENRQRTSYADDESNWAILCPSCQEECDEHWEELWQDYYASRM